MSVDVNLELNEANSFQNIMWLMHCWRETAPIFLHLNPRSSVERWTSSKGHNPIVRPNFNQPF